MMLQSSTSSVASRCAVQPFTSICVRPVICRASMKNKQQDTAKPFGGVLAGLAAACLVLSPAAPVLAAAQDLEQSPIDAAYEAERAIQEQRSMVEFKLQQQENAKKAELNAQRKSLERQVVLVESQLEQKLTEQKANVVGATTKGDLKKAEIIEAQVQELTAKLEQVKLVAAQLNSQVDRAEILERAKAQAARQSISKAANDLDAAVNQRLNQWLESVKPSQ